MSWLSKGFKGIERGISNAIPHQHSADRRAANQAVAEQIDYYQKAKDEMAAESKRVEDERAAGKKKIAEKQIKGMQRAYRSPGFLEETSSNLSNKLG